LIGPRDTSLRRDNETAGLLQLREAAEFQRQLKGFRGRDKFTDDTNVNAQRATSGKFKKLIMKGIRDRLQWRRRSGHGVHRSSKAEGKRQINHVSGFRDRLPVAIIFATDPERIPKPASVTYKTNSVLPRHKLRSLLNTERRRNSSRGRPVVNLRATARTHLARVFEKTGTRRQISFLSMMPCKGGGGPRRPCLRHSRLKQFGTYRVVALSGSELLRLDAFRTLRHRRPPQTTHRN
jgi:hypothetical protein